MRVVDRAPACLVGERRVGAVEQPAHVHLLGENGEAVRVQLGEVEHVADEPAELLRLGGDDLERRVGQLGIGDDAFAQGGDMAANRGRGRAQLVRDGHEEVALALLRLRETGRHLAKALREMTDLVVRRHVGHLDVVVPRGDLVHCL